MNRVDIIKIIIFAAILIMLAMISIWSEKHDRNIEAAAKSYEECVSDKYNGMTVQQVYHETGTYPECAYE